MATEIVELDPDLYALEQDIVRMFLIVGTERALLVDAGAEKCDLPALIKSVTDLPCDVFLTHCDGDHTENAQQFSHIFCPEDDLARIASDRPGPEYTGVGDGYVFDLGDRHLEVLHVPGHTPGHSCVLCRDEGWLITGDCVSYDTVFLFGPHRDPARYRASLDELAMLRAEFSLLYPCHGPCPLPVSAIDEMRDCFDAWKSGEIAPEKADFPFPLDEPIAKYSLGSCSIFVPAAGGAV